DLRIVDANNQQIPYLLEKREDVFPVKLPALAAEKSSSPTQSRYPLQLPFENLPPAKLVVTTTDRVFQRRASLEVRRPAVRHRLEPVVETVASAVWSHNDPETSAPALTLNIPRSLGTTSAALVIEEGDNRPLPLKETRLELPLFRLRFFYPR